MHVPYSGHFVLYVPQSTRLALPNTAILYLWVPKNKTSGQVHGLSHNGSNLSVFLYPSVCVLRVKNGIPFLFCVSETGQH